MVPPLFLSRFLTLKIYDVVRYRIHRIKKKVKDELEDKNTVQEYICPNCNRRYSALDALLLVSYNKHSFHCENCNTELVAESDKFAAEEKGEGDDNGRRGRRERVKDLLEKMEVMLSFLKEFEEKLDTEITCSQETEPMRTAGPLALGRDELDDGSGEPFFVLNTHWIKCCNFTKVMEEKH